MIFVDKGESIKVGTQTYELQEPEELIEPEGYVRWYSEECYFVDFINQGWGWYCKAKCMCFDVSFDVPEQAGFNPSHVDDARPIIGFFEKQLELYNKLCH